MQQKTPFLMSVGPAKLKPEFFSNISRHSVNHTLFDTDKTHGHKIYIYTNTKTVTVLHKM